VQDNPSKEVDKTAKRGITFKEEDRTF